MSKNITNTEAFKKWFGDSKVVDKEGKPLVVYHGTKQEFNSFNRSVNFFTSKNKVAKTYGKVKECYLKLENPYIVKDKDKYSSNFEHIIEVGGKTISIAKLSYDLMYEGIYDGLIVENVYDTLSRTEPLDEYLSDVYVVFNYNSNQIKLADGTNTTFDADNPDIRFKEGGELSRKTNLNGVRTILKKKYPKLDIKRGDD